MLDNLFLTYSENIWDDLQFNISSCILSGEKSTGSQVDVYVGIGVEFFSH